MKATNYKLMRILSAEEVKDNKALTDADRIARTQRLREEETIASKALNDTREFAAVETAKIEADLADVEEKAIARKKVLVDEIASLENQKKEAMAPIHEIRQEAEQRLEAAKNREVEVERREVAIAEREQLLADRAIALVSREEANEEKADDLDTREERIAGEEKRLKESEVALAEKWAVHHGEVAKANASLERREKEVEDGKKANAAYAASLYEKDRKQADEWKAIRSGYAALEEAKKHLTNGRREEG